MSKFYIANENGDWWVVNNSNGSGQKLFVISEEELSEVVASENPEDAGVPLSHIDGLAGVIISNGSSVKIDLE